MQFNGDSLRGANLKKVRAIWTKLGGTVANKPRTGEDVYRHPKWPKPIVMNKRRKDASRELTKVVGQLLRQEADARLSV